MRLKKGFTLAEILIVLMIIGVIATMTIPALMKSVTETQWKTGLKKAYNTIVNLVAMERVSGSVPTTADATGVLKMFEMMDTNLAVKDYVPNSATNGVVLNSGVVIGSGNANAIIKNGVSYTNTSGVKVSTGSTNDQAALTGTTAPWINTEDGFSYLVLKGTGTTTTCGTKATINAQTTISALLSNSCVVVAVDVNGLTKGPNKVETQINPLTGAAINNPLATLTGDQYYIYIGIDGATAGPKKSTATGRIVADIK